MKYSLYVDDRMWSTPSVMIANSTLTELLPTSLKRGFKLVKFIATNEKILESISGDASMHLFIIDVQLYHISGACHIFVVILDLLSYACASLGTVVPWWWCVTFAKVTLSVL